ncbi:METHYLENE BLUE SENSITIVITY 1 [Hibiscus trionum]|uniref:METHYLENE BLUE SENSITIVITY 1 n=1 Tax=Hibiscus trionum TaxID=183268 RepID=A0A9W7I724_HIBTR|nr:METHYLENE BLUE SENSITIVITY 1 [Hibiscus trionum]
MTGKAKPKKHTAKEIAAKVDAATTNRGGGKAGLADRSGVEKGGHAKYECPHCKTTAPDLKSMQIHHDAKHPKIPFEESKLVNRHADLVAVAESSSKPRPGVRGHVLLRVNYVAAG